MTKQELKDAMVWVNCQCDLGYNKLILAALHSLRDNGRALGVEEIIEIVANFETDCERNIAQAIVKAQKEGV